MPAKQKIPPAMKRYFWRVGIFMMLYMLTLVAGLWLKSSGALGQGPLSYLVAILTALPICAVFWTIFRLLVEMEDEYQRLLVAKQIMLATAITLCISTIWDFLLVYELTAHGPKWIGAIFFAMFGLAGGLVRWKA